MGLFSSGKSSSRDNSGQGGKGFTVTGTAQGKRQVKAIRKEWSAPRRGGSGFGSKTRRPGQGPGGR